MQGGLKLGKCPLYGSCGSSPYYDPTAISKLGESTPSSDELAYPSYDVGRWVRLNPTRISCDSAKIQLIDRESGQPVLLKASHGS